MFEKVLIANRGEIAVRIIRTLKILGVKSVAVFSDADKELIHVRMADEAYHIGDPEPKKSYLNKELLVETALKAGADAVHPGYGFLAENSDFASICRKEGLTFIGPSPETLELTSNKARCRNIASTLGIPVTPGSEGEVKDVSKAKEICRELGYPVLIKSVYGGGGRGIREARDEMELENLWNQSIDESQSVFGRASLYIEKMIRPARHIEIQILANRNDILHLGERECSIQRRYQKLIEVTPSPVVNEDERRLLADFSISFARAVSYKNAGTIEFIRDQHGNYFFTEINSRLQVEHPITEEVTGIDIVKQQVLIASGEVLEFKQQEIKSKGFAMECRINAEDPLNDFAPESGVVKRVRLPAGRNVRVDSFLSEGIKISEYYDPLVAKVITKGDTFDEARRLMLAALDEMKVEGIKTNIPFHKEVLENDSFKKGMMNTNFIEEESILDKIRARYQRDRSRAELYGAIILSSMLSRGIGKRKRKGIKKGKNYSSTIFEFHCNNRKIITDVRSNQGYDLVSIGSRLFRVELTEIGVDEYLAKIDGERLIVRLLDESAESYMLEIEGHVIEYRSKRIRSEGEETKVHISVISPLPGKIIAVKVREGDRVKFGDEVVIIESMKTQVTIRAERDAVISSVKIKEGDLVKRGQVLIELTA